MTSWGDVVARSRGLSDRLLRPDRMSELGAAPSVAALAEQLTALRLVPASAPGVPADEHVLELALRRRAGARLRILHRWAGPRAPLLAPLFDDEDRRALRALVHGAIAGVPPDARLAGLVPTPALPLRALDALAHAGDVATMAALLMAWTHPFGAALATEARRQQPDLLQLEMALVRAFAERARIAARRGDGAMRHFVERTIDLENLSAAIVLAGHESDLEPASVFVEGGAIVAPDDLRLGANAKVRSALITRLAPRVRGTPLAAALEAGVRHGDDAALDALVTEFRRLARREPLGLAPVILFVLRQRAELHVLMRIVWSVSLGVPRAAIARAIGVAA